MDQVLAAKIEVYACSIEVSVLWNSAAEVCRLGESDQLESREIRRQRCECITRRKIEGVNQLANGEVRSCRCALQRVSSKVIAGGSRGSINQSCGRDY